MAWAARCQPRGEPAVERIGHLPRQRLDGLRRRPAGAELVQGEQRDVRIGVAGGGERRVAGTGVLPRAQRTERLVAHQAGLVTEPGADGGGAAGRLPARRGAHHEAADLRVRIRDRPLQGRLVHRAGIDQRLEREAADARVPQRIVAEPGVGIGRPGRLLNGARRLWRNRRQRGERGHRLGARRVQLSVEPHQRLEPLGHAEPNRTRTHCRRRGRRRAPTRRAPSAPRWSAAGGRASRGWPTGRPDRLRRAGDRSAGARPGRQSGAHGGDRRPAAGRPGRGRSPPRSGSSGRRCRSDRAMSATSTGRSRRPSARTAIRTASASRLRVPARITARSRAVGARRSSAWTMAARRAGWAAARAPDSSTTATAIAAVAAARAVRFTRIQSSPQIPGRRGVLEHLRRQILRDTRSSTSVIRPAASATGSSRGMTKPV